MKAYAKCMRNKERNRKACKQVVKIATLPNDMMLPTVDDILQNNTQSFTAEIEQRTHESCR